jgi:regulator of cell morphogenesis and NO signaling
VDILPRFGIGLGFQERTVKQICDEKGIPSSVFLFVCNVYTFDNYRLDELIFKDIPAGVLLDFLSISHSDYIQKQANISGTVIELAEKIASDSHCKAMAEMADRYRRLLQNHIDREEQVEFPFIMALLENKSPKSMSCHQKSTHDDELYTSFGDLQSIITKYLTDDSLATSGMFRNVLVDIAMFHADVDKHILIEEWLWHNMGRMTNCQS